MPPRPTLGTEAAKTEAVRLLRLGNGTRLAELVYHERLHLWNDDWLFRILAAGPKCHQKRVECPSYDPTPHYELVAELLQAKVVSDGACWNTQALERWIDLLVEMQYPWFVCKVWTRWNHLKQEAIAILHRSSLFHHHCSNLHKLLHHEWIPHLWCTDFLDSSEDIHAFLSRIGRSKDPSRRRRDIAQQFDHFPFEHKKHFDLMFEALVVCEEVSLTKRFLQCSGAEVYWNYRLVMVCIEYNALELMNWILQQCRFVPTVYEWYRMACKVHPYHLEGRLHRNFRSDGKYRQMKCLLSQFDSLMPAEDWIRLYTYTVSHPRDHTFPNLLVLTKKGHELFEYVWSRVVSALRARTLPVFIVLDDLNITEMTLPPAMALEPAALIRYIQTCTQSRSGWTIMANAFKWGTRATVEWLLEHGAECAVQCTGHNTLSLACYNKGHGLELVEMLVGTQEKHRLRAWLKSGCDDIITALTRNSMDLETGKEFLVRLLPICDPYDDSIKSDLLQAFFARFETLVNDDDDDAIAQHFPFFVRPCSNWAQSYVSFHPYLQAIFEHPGGMTGLSCQTLFKRCLNFQQFERRFTVLMKHGMHTLVPLYTQLIEYAASRSGHAFHPFFLGCMERSPQFLHEIRSCSNSNQRRHIVKAWVKHPHYVFSKFLVYARDAWGWFLSSDLLEEPLIVPQCNETKWHALLSTGQYPLISYSTDPSYRQLAKAYRCIRRMVQRLSKKAREDVVYYLNRCHWEMECTWPTTAKPVTTADNLWAQTLLGAALL